MLCLSKSQTTHTVVGNLIDIPAKYGSGRLKHRLLPKPNSSITRGTMYPSAFLISQWASTRLWDHPSGFGSGGTPKAPAGQGSKSQVPRRDKGESCHRVVTGRLSEGSRKTEHMSLSLSKLSCRCGSMNNTLGYQPSFRSRSRGYM